MRSSISYSGESADIERTQNRCPECGACFRWSEEIAKARGLASDLFEFQARRRLVRSFLRSSVWLRNLWRFGRQVPGAPRPHVAALLGQVVLTFIFGGALMLGADYVRNWVVICIWSSPGRVIHFYWYEGIGDLVWLGTPHLIFGILIWLLLQIFWRTRISHGIRQPQLLRVVAYPLLTLILSGAVACAS